MLALNTPIKKSQTQYVNTLVPKVSGNGRKLQTSLLLASAVFHCFMLNLI